MLAAGTLCDLLRALFFLRAFFFFIGHSVPFKSQHGIPYPAKRPSIARESLQKWQARRDSNPQHPDLESGALTVRATGLYENAAIWFPYEGYVSGKTGSTS